MSDQSKPPRELSFTGDLANNWRLWKQKFQVYLIASDKNSKPDEVKIAILLNQLGDEGIGIYNTFEYTTVEDPPKLETILKKFDTYSNPIKNLVYEHYKFFKRNQNLDETVDQFVTALRQLVSTCEFREKDVLIRDRIVLGIRDQRIQDKLLQSPYLQLNEAITICHSMECSVATQKEISRESVDVNVINYRNRGKNSRKNSEAGHFSGYSKKYKWHSQGHSSSYAAEAVSNTKVHRCKRCGDDNHEKGTHCSTFGGNPLSSKIAMTALEVLQEENLIENSFKMGNIFRNELRNRLNKEAVFEVRGRGLMNAIVLNRKYSNAWDICLKLKDNGLLTEDMSEDIIRFAPPLTITQEELEESIDIIIKTVNLIVQ